MSISPKFYEKLLRAQIPKAQKRQSSSQSVFALLGSVRAKNACRTLVKLTPACHLSISFPWLKFGKSQIDVKS